MANNQCAEFFGLSIEQTCLLYSLQRYITSHDIDTSPTKTKKDNNRLFLKKAWLEAWDTAIHVNLKSTLHAPEAYVRPLYSLSECQDLKNQVEKQAGNDLWKYLILLECTLYTPYFILEDASDKEVRKRYRERYKGVSCNTARKEDALETIAGILDLDPSYIQIFQNEYKAAMKLLTGYWIKVLGYGVGGIIAILIAIATFQYEILGLFAAPGLSGAALVSSGLAALGGGALAAGGFGMAGGTAVLVGGGSLLGASFGTGVGALVTSAGSGLIASEAAKQIVIRATVLKDNVVDEISIPDITRRLEENYNKMEDELKRLKGSSYHSDDDKKAIKNLKSSTKIMKRLLKRIRKI